MHTSLKYLCMVSDGKLESDSTFTAGAQRVQTVEKLPIITLTTMCAFVLSAKKEKLSVLRTNINTVGLPAL